jgi:hypothetical protein
MNKGGSEGLEKGVNRKLEEKEGILFTLQDNPLSRFPHGGKTKF